MEVKSLELKCFGEINDVLRTRAEIEEGSVRGLWKLQKRTEKH